MLYIKIDLIKLRYSIFPYISSYFKHFTWPLVFVSCLQQTARAREPITYVLPKLVINVKDWSAKDNREISMGYRPEARGYVSYSPRCQLHVVMEYASLG